MSDSLERLFASVVAARGRDPAVSRTAKLFRDGVQKMAKKLIEEAIEVGLDAVQMNREAAILESADVLYQLAVVWAECGIAPGRRVRRDRSPRARLRHRREVAQASERRASSPPAGRLAGAQSPFVTRGSPRRRGVDALPLTLGTGAIKSSRRTRSRTPIVAASPQVDGGCLSESKVDDQQRYGSVMPSTSFVVLLILAKLTRLKWQQRHT